MAQTASWLPSASSERRSEYDNPGHSAPRPIPPPSDLNRWDLSEILNPSARERKLNMDFSSSSHHHPLYPHNDLDQSFILPSENVSSALALFPKFLIFLLGQCFI